MTNVLRTTLSLAAMAALSGCLFPFGSSSSSEGGGTPTPTGQCDVDLECGSPESSTGCTEMKCVAKVCKETNLPKDAAPTGTSSALVCHRALCDGNGATYTVVDPTATPPASTTACHKASCDDSGNIVSEVDPTNVPSDTPHDCHKSGCDASGNVTASVDTSDVPADAKGDCQLPACDASGKPTSTADNTDVPADSVCATGTCSAGKPTMTPANAGKVCDDAGYACGATSGQCDTCPTPDAACSDHGFGANARSAASAHDFAGIGRCDDGGRYSCDAVAGGQAAWYTYQDDGTGLLCDFDPYFEVKPMAPVTMCTYFECPSIQCPGGTRVDNAIPGKPGCCFDASPGASYTGAAIPFCNGARVLVKVQATTSTCTGFQMHFKD